MGPVDTAGRRGGITITTSSVPAAPTRQQARVENRFSRYKSILGGGLKVRNCNAQRKEVVIGCHGLNRMVELGRPESYAVVS